MTTIYAYFHLFDGFVLAAPHTPGQADPPVTHDIISNMGRMPCPGGIENMSTQDIKTLLEKTYHQPGITNGYGQAVFYDGASYGKDDHPIVHTRALT